MPDLCANIALLTAGRDKSYALGLAEALIQEGVSFEFLGSDSVDDPGLHDSPKVVFRNLRGNQAEDAPWVRKVVRVLAYYRRLLVYAAKAPPTVFHILWNNKFEWFDRTVLMLLYRMLGRKLVLTIHNVNAGRRDGSDSFLNRQTLRIQYKLAHHLFVHTKQMQEELQKDFMVPDGKVSVIPFGVNSTVPDTALDCATARRRLGLEPEDRVLLFFGNIAAYKGLEYLVQALAYLPTNGVSYRLVIAGRVKTSREYWQRIEKSISQLRLVDRVLRRIEYIPDEDTEVYFKAADVLVLPYTFIFQSGVLFLGYNFGLPVIAADVGSLKEDIIEGETGFLCRPKDPENLARTIQTFFESDLYRELTARRRRIREFAAERYSWSRVATITADVYSRLLPPE